MGDPQYLRAGAVAFQARLQCQAEVHQNLGVLPYPDEHLVRP